MSSTTDPLLSADLTHAVVAYLVKRYNELAQGTLGRTILQKLCYFAKANGVPLRFRFEIYHYGPFSQEIFEVTEDLLVDDVISDASNVPGKSRYVPAENCDTVLKLC